MGAQKITWMEPLEDTVTDVEISKSSSKYGTYTVLTTISATSDGLAKSSTNTWVVTYTDPSGSITDWYKVRFYDSDTLIYSDYSEPITTQELLQLCTVDDVKREIDTVGRWTDDEIFSTIITVDDWIYIEYGTPLEAAVSDIGYTGETFERRYYVGEQNIHRIDRVFIGTTTKTELFLEDEYRHNLPYGMVELFSTTDGGLELARDYSVEVHYVPRLYHKLSLWMTIVRLLERTDFMTSGKPSKDMIVARQNLEDVQRLLAHRNGLALSSDVQNYDFVYGVNRKVVKQDFSRNKYMANDNTWTS